MQKQICVIFIWSLHWQTIMDLCALVAITGNSNCFATGIVPTCALLGTIMSEVTRHLTDVS